MQKLYKITGKKVPDLYVEESRTAAAVEKIIENASSANLKIKITEIEVFNHEETMLNFQNAMVNLIDEV